MPWELKNDRPIYLQLMEQISYHIISGEYSIGSKLPSVRDLAAESSVNPNTMQKALSELERSGLIFTNRTSGRFITEDAAMIQTMKLDLAKKELQNFLKQLQKLGFNEQEVKQFIIEQVK
ncbi:MAG: GntR family transcriptional regulator [Velocimicrobium sp.]